MTTMKLQGMNGFTFSAKIAGDVAKVSRACFDHYTLWLLPLTGANGKLYTVRISRGAYVLRAV